MKHPLFIIRDSVSYRPVYLLLVSFIPCGVFLFQFISNWHHVPWIFSIEYHLYRPIHEGLVCCLIFLDLWLHNLLSRGQACLSENGSDPSNHPHPTHTCPHPSLNTLMSRMWIRVKQTFLRVKLCYKCILHYFWRPHKKRVGLSVAASFWVKFYPLFSQRHLGTRIPAERIRSCAVTVT